MNFLTTLFENSNMPWFSALVLGFMTAISPCPLATNITAIGFVSKDIENRNRVFINGLLYTLGRSISYISIALIIYLGADQFQFSGFFQKYGEKFTGPFLILTGLLMLEIIKINFPGINRLTSGLDKRIKRGYTYSLLLGIVFAMAFCPYSGVLFFGMLIPMTISSAGGLYLPLVFAIATGIPVIVFAWILAFSVGSTGKLYNKVKSFEFWFRRIISVLFIIIGLVYSFKAFI